MRTKPLRTGREGRERKGKKSKGGVQAEREVQERKGEVEVKRSKKKILRE